MTDKWVEQMKNKVKFSIIVPVYNVEKYLEKCLDSLINQTYQNFEVIIVCDKCNDNSEIIVDKYIKENNNFTKIYEEKTGLSKARNIGVTYAKGEYLLFLDSDDYYEKNLLENLLSNLNDNPEIIRFQVQDIKENQIIKYPEKGFATTNGKNAFNIIRNYHYIEPAWCYCYNLKFWKENNFKYKENCIGEDFGLTPYVIYKSKRIKSIENIGYNYVKRENSLMTNNDYNKKIKKTNDLLLQARELKEKIKNHEENYQFISFINFSIIYNITTLTKKDYKKYKKILKEEHYFDYIENNTIKNKIKKLILKTSPWFYYNCLKR